MRALGALIAAAMLLGACQRGGPVENAPAAEGSATAAPEAPARPADERLLGTFELAVQPDGAAGALGLRFEPGTLVRTIDGEPTATEAYRVLETNGDRVSIELVGADGQAKRRVFVLHGEDAVADGATPELQYVRVHPLPPAGSGLGEGSR